ncbi:MAG: MGH1-like glycoside hydrolase domain-containing protein [Muribaculaceae bacterium]
MKKLLISFAAAACATGLVSAREIVKTPAYTWHGDTITQGVYMAYAPNDTVIISTYSAQPGYYMGIDKEWHKRNDLSGYPQLSTPNTLHRAIYNMGMDEMVNAVEPDTTLRTGKEWSGVWTRDVSYSILLSMAYMQPEATRISLLRKVDPMGRVIQDTGSGGAWPVSTDRMIWAAAAYELYLVTGDKDWLKTIYPIIKKSLYDDRSSGLYSAKTGLVKGETSFIDWREQSYPKWMQTADIYQSEALGTSIVHARAWEVLSRIAAELGHKDVSKDAAEQAQKIADGVNANLWNKDKGYYNMYLYGRDNLIDNPRAETLGETLSILWDVADADRARTITENNPTTPFGVGIFYPQIADMPAYHNNALWPWVGAYWAIANAKAGNEQGVMQGIGAVYRPAALFATNKENFVLENGDIATELNSSNMLWCLAGNIALTHKILFGIDFTEKGLAFHPFVPKALGEDRTLSGFEYRGCKLNITVKGFGSKISSFTVDGKEQAALITPAQAKKAKGKTLDVVIVMDNQPIAPLKVNNVSNAKAPLTPIARLEGKTLVWNPIEYIGSYVIVRDGKRIDTVHTTTYDASIPGEYQVIGVSTDGVEGFASEPMSTRMQGMFQPEKATKTMTSGEIKYQPTGDIAGFTGQGFAETDHANQTVTVPVVIPEDGEYTLSVRYANGNGPVNTGRSCGIRTVELDGASLGTVVMPHRGKGNWSDWGYSNSVDFKATKGKHVVTIVFKPYNENMDMKTNHVIIDAVRLNKK